MYFNELTGEKRRQLINAQEVFLLWRQQSVDKHRRFQGGMRWGRRSEAHYLLRKTGAIEHSLGVRDLTTEAAYEAFMAGRNANRERLKSLAVRLDEMAPINRAMGLGRIPLVAARIARHCDQKRLLGDQLFIVGTNALFAYEALAGVQFEGDLLATDDIDLLFDARRRVSLAVRDGIRAEGLIGVLRQADKSFEPVSARGYRAANKDGYLVDLICPQDKDVLRAGSAKSLSAAEDDLEGAEIVGLEWLINGPKVETVVLDERGYPAPIVAIDPRAYALHKFWLSARTDRARLKAMRDLAQARAVAALARDHLNLDFNSHDLSALPEAMRQLPADFGTLKGGTDSETPDW